MISSFFDELSKNVAGEARGNHERCGNNDDANNILYTCRHRYEKENEHGKDWPAYFVRV